MNIQNLKNIYANNKAYGKIDGNYAWNISSVEIKEAEKPDSNGEINAYVLVSGTLSNGRTYNKTLFSEIDNNAFKTASAYDDGKINAEATVDEVIKEVIEKAIDINIRIETIAKKDSLGTIKRYTNIYYTDVPTAEIIEETSTDGVTIIE